jgi:hypothetical protein
MIGYFLHASVVEWSITTDCKSVALRASLVQIQPGAHEYKTTALKKLWFYIHFNAWI